MIFHTIIAHDTLRLQEKWGLYERNFSGSRIETVKNNQYNQNHIHTEVKAMERIASFNINHLELLPGLYVSRRDRKGDCTVTTFDMRLTAPNREPVVDVPALHTIEHMAATYLRNSDRKEDIVYFGPMGCRTGCYLVMFGDLDPEDIFDLVTDMCGFILSYEGDIPGAEPEQCGNYSEQNLNMARYYIRKYRDELVEHQRFTYPD